MALFPRLSQRPSLLVIRALSHFVGGADPEELVLCPVRALLEYYERAKQEGHVGTRKRLFVSARTGKMADISAATITRWIKQVILQAHKVILDQDLRVLEVKAHQVRAVATSLAFRSATLEQVLEMGGWVNHSTFTDFYLKTLTNQNENRYQLHPCVTGAVVSQL